MSYIVRSGTTEFQWSADNVVPPGWVLFTGQIVYEADARTPAMVWDGALNNIRAMLAADYTARATLINQRARDAAKLLIAADDPISKEIKALILVILDTFNRQSQQFRDLLAAIAAATSLVNLQTRAAAITPEPAHVAADIKTAMGNKLDAGLADG